MPRELWAEQERDNYRLAAESGLGEEVDPLLAELRRPVRDRDEAHRRMLRLLAYGREFVRPRPYPLTELGAAADLSRWAHMLGFGGHRLVMEVLGHSQINLTMNTYSHVMPAMLGAAAT